MLLWVPDNEFKTQFPSCKNYKIPVQKDSCDTETARNSVSQHVTAFELTYWYDEQKWRQKSEIEFRKSDIIKM